MTTNNCKYQIEICLKAFEYVFIKKAQHQLNKLLQNQFMTPNEHSIFNICALPLKISKYTVIRSPHIDKKSRDQFEIREHKIILKHKEYWSLRTLYFFLENIKHNKFYGVHIQIKILSLSTGPKKQKILAS